MNYWTTEEIDQVESIAGDIPYPLLWKSYNKWAEKNGYEKRSIKAIEAVARKHGFSLKPTGKWVTTGYVATVLGLPPSTVSSWIHRKYLPKRINTPFAYILREDLKQLAISKPHLFSGINADRLYALLEDKDLADSIAANYRKREYWKKPVRAIETGVIYESVMEAGRCVHIVHHEIRKAIRLGKRAAGCHWEFVQ